MVESVSNAAGQRPAAMPGAGLARGAIISLVGTGLGPTEGIEAAADELTAALAGVTVEIAQSDSPWQALPLFVSATRIDALIPPNAPLGMASLTVNYLGETSEPVEIPVIPSGLGLYPLESEEFSRKLNSPVARGARYMLRGTGLGTTLGSGRHKRAKKRDLELFVGGRRARLLSARPSGCCEGVDEIEFEVPKNAPGGCGTPVQARLFGSLPSNVVPLPIGPSGEACPGFRRARETLRGGGNAGVVLLIRADIYNDLPELGEETLFLVDIGLAGFLSQNQSPEALEPFLALPPPGACTAYIDTLGSFPFKTLDERIWQRILDGNQPLDVGRSLKVRWADETRFIPVSADHKGLYSALSLLLEPGSYTVSTEGGSAVGPFAVSIPVPEPIQWTNRDRMAQIDRSRDLTIRWKNGADGTVMVAGFNVDRTTQSSVFFLCRERAAKRRLTVPTAILQMIPPTRQGEHRAGGVLFVGTGLEPDPATFEAQGLDFGAGIGLNLSGRTVRFR